MAMAFAPLKKLNFSRSICATCQFNISLGKYSREVHSQNSTKLERSPSKTRELSKIEPSRSQRSQQKRLLHRFFGEHPYRINKTDASQQRLFSSSIPVSKHETITIHFIKPDGSRESVDAKVGDNLLDVVVDKDVDIDGFGACEGTLACSTCHLVFKEHDYKQIKDPLTDEELDMLDLAYGLCDTSRLGCQVIVTKEMDGWEITVPSGIEDARG